jgi:hypothetical protein
MLVIFVEVVVLGEFHRFPCHVSHLDDRLRYLYSAVASHGNFLLDKDFFLMLTDRAKLVFLYDLRVPESSLVLMVLTWGGMIGIFSFLFFLNRCG